MRLQKRAVLEFCGQARTGAQARARGWTQAKEHRATAGGAGEASAEPLIAQRVRDAAGEGAEELKASSRKLDALQQLRPAPAAGFLVGFLAGAWRLISGLWSSGFRSSHLGFGNLILYQSVSEKVSCTFEVLKCLQAGIQSWWLVVEIILPG